VESCISLFKFDKSFDVFFSSTYKKLMSFYI